MLCEKRWEGLQAGADIARCVAAGTACGAEADPRAGALIVRAHDGRRAVRRLLAGDVDVHRCVVGQGILCDDLLLGLVSPLLGNALADDLRRLLAGANRLHAGGRLCGTSGNGDGHSDNR
ncbi:Deoxyguanosinetriphosphate triphosphohydrolase [Paraburkholderia caribensis]|nr:Deoxyguanosinetriphosphate triphosphohydrolase [Paraburkholderia caribensis]